MTKVLITAGSGMLGHRMVRALSPHYLVYAGMRPGAPEVPSSEAVRFLPSGDLTQNGAVEQLLDAAQCDVVVNTVGLIKQRKEATHAMMAVAVNSLLPQKLAVACSERGMRLIHFSTDCVFSGARDSDRGPDGYRESDLTDARDLYGLSKRLGEPIGPGCITIRTSLVGAELRGHHGLVSWFLNQPDKSVRGYKKAIFTGLSTGVAAELARDLIDSHPDLDGVWHVAAEPINKFDFLHQLRNRLSMPVEIQPDEEFFCDRRLDGARFRSLTGWRAPSWSDMIDGIVSDHLLSMRRVSR